MTLHSFIDGAEWIWAIWLISLTAGAWMTLRAMKRRSRFRWADLRGERGVSYTLSFVITFPIYVLICMTIFETTMLVMTKIGTVYAAYAGSRSLVVWEAMRPDLRDDRVRQAVVTGLAPFVVSSNATGSETGDPPANAQTHAENYVDALEKFSGNDVLRDKLIAHVRRVSARVTLTRVIPVRKHGEEASVEVEFRAPLITPGVARLLDPDHAYPYEIPIRSSVRMTLECPETPDGTLGIDYRSF